MQVFIEKTPRRNPRPRIWRTAIAPFMVPGSSPAWQSMARRVPDFDGPDLVPIPAPGNRIAAFGSAAIPAPRRIGDQEIPEEARLTVRSGTAAFVNPLFPRPMPHFEVAEEPIGSYLLTAHYPVWPAPPPPPRLVPDVIWQLASRATNWVLSNRPAIWNLTNRPTIWQEASR